MSVAPECRQNLMVARAGALNARQMRFVIAYLGAAGFNAAKAARMAGYRGNRQAGWRLRNRPEIARLIDAHLQAAARHSALVVAELSDIAAAPWRDFITVTATNADGQPARAHLDLTDKVRALELLGRVYRLFPGAESRAPAGSIVIHDSG